MEAKALFEKVLNHETTIDRRKRFANKNPSPEMVRYMKSPKRLCKTEFIGTLFSACSNKGLLMYNGDNSTIFFVTPRMKAFFPMLRNYNYLTYELIDKVWLSFTF